MRTQYIPERGRDWSFDHRIPLIEKAKRDHTTREQRMRQRTLEKMARQAKDWMPKTTEELV